MNLYLLISKGRGGCPEKEEGKGCASSGGRGGKTPTKSQRIDRQGLRGGARGEEKGKTRQGATLNEGEQWRSNPKKKKGWLVGKGEGKRKRQPKKKTCPFR